MVLEAAGHEVNRQDRGLFGSRAPAAPPEKGPSTPPDVFFFFFFLSRRLTAKIIINRPLSLPLP